MKHLNENERIYIKSEGVWGKIYAIHYKTKNFKKKEDGLGYEYMLEVDAYSILITEKEKEGEYRYLEHINRDDLLTEEQYKFTLL